MPQLLLEQVAVPLVELQTTPHPPQLVGSEEILVSQPSLAAGPLQSAKPALQVMPQLPFVQVAAPLAELQTCPQLPQLLRSLLVSTQDPLQKVWPAKQTQVPLTHVWPPEQVLPQVPQLLLSFCRLTQEVPQAVNVLLQVKLQAPLVQVAVALSGGVQSAAVQQLLLGMHAPLHCLNPLLQAKLQAPFTHAGTALATLVEHVFLHAPQLAGSDCRFLQVPLQLVCPVGQHSPALQLDPAAQVLPHVPQLLLSVCVLVQVPLQRVFPEGQAQMHLLLKVWPPVQVG
jgi:hypothetical protein